MAKQALCVVLLALCGSGLAVHLPAAWPTCKVKDPNFNKCLASAVTNVLHTLKDGDKQVALSSVDPLRVDAVTLTLDSGSGSFAFVMDTTNISYLGLGQTEVREASVDMAKHEIKLKVFNPFLRWVFTYKAQGKILLIAIQGDGPAYIHVDKPISDIVIKGTPFEKKGKTYWNMTDFSLDMKPEHLSSDFHELLKGNAAISAQVNDFLNKEWKIFFQGIKRPAEEAYAQIFLTLTQRVFSRVPIAEIFPQE